MCNEPLTRQSSSRRRRCGRSVAKDLMAMKVAELKDELEARGEARSGSKAWLRRRLHAAIVREYLEGA